MSTHCLIGTNPSHMVEVHFDGYPEHIIPRVMKFIEENGWEKFCEEINTPSVLYIRSIGTTIEKVDSRIAKPNRTFKSALEEKDPNYEYIYLFENGKLKAFAAFEFVNMVIQYNQHLTDDYMEYWL